MSVRVRQARRWLLRRQGAPEHGGRSHPAVAHAPAHRDVCEPRLPRRSSDGPPHEVSCVDLPDLILQLHWKTERERGEEAVSEEASVFAKEMLMSTTRNGEREISENGEREKQQGRQPGTGMIRTRTIGLAVTTVQRRLILGAQCLIGGRVLYGADFVRAQSRDARFDGEARPNKTQDPESGFNASATGFTPASSAGIVRGASSSPGRAPRQHDRQP